MVLRLNKKFLTPVLRSFFALGHLSLLIKVPDATFVEPGTYEFEFWLGAEAVRSCRIPVVVSDVTLPIPHSLNRRCQVLNQSTQGLVQCSTPSRRDLGQHSLLNPENRCVRALDFGAAPLCEPRLDDTAMIGVRRPLHQPSPL